MRVKILADSARLEDMLISALTPNPTLVRQAGSVGC